MIKAVIFDMDGTLVDTEPIYHRANAALYEYLGIEIDHETTESFIGTDVKKKMSLIKEKGKLSNPLDELILLSEKYKLDAVSSATIPIFLGIPELIEKLLSRDLQLALASSSNWSIINLNLNSSGLNKYFDTKVSGEDISNGKPAPDIFLATAKILNLQPKECMVIEDSKNGVLGALAARMIAVGHKDENSHQDLSMAHLVVPSYNLEYRRQILELIAKGK